LARQHGAHGPVQIPDRQFERDLLSTINRRCALFDELAIQNLGNAVILLLHAIPRDVRTDIGHLE